MCDAGGTPAPSYAELESQLAAAVAAREEAERALGPNFKDAGMTLAEAITHMQRLLDEKTRQHAAAEQEAAREHGACLVVMRERDAAEARAAEAEADVARLERLHAACDATIRELTSKALAAVRGQEAAEARAERLAGALREIAPQIEGFCVQAETDSRPPGGQQAGMDRSWAVRTQPSVISELRWYAREFRRLLAALAEEGRR